MKHTRTRILAAVVATLFVGVAAAQPAPPPGEEPDQPGRPAPAFPAPVLGAVFGNMMERFMPVSVSATDDAVFVVRGDRLYKFDPNTLKLLAETQLPRAPGIDKLWKGIFQMRQGAQKPKAPKGAVKKKRPVPEPKMPELREKQ